MTFNRRDFIRGTAGAASAAALAGAQEERLPRERLKELLPAPDVSGIEHIVVVMMENRSFDHHLGWLPGAKGKQAGLRYFDGRGDSHPTFRLTSYVGCFHPDPDHAYAGGRSEYDDGKMDGWLRTSSNDTFSIGYYEEADLPFYAALARNFTTLDNYFPSILSSTFPNRPGARLLIAGLHRPCLAVDCAAVPESLRTVQPGACTAQRELRLPSPAEFASHRGGRKGVYSAADSHRPGSSEK